MRSKNIALVSVAAVMAAACSQQGDSGAYSRASSGSTDPIVARTTSAVRSGETDFIASKGPVPVRVQGSAFGLDRGTLERTIANDMQGANWGPDARFIPASQIQPNSNPGQDYSVVIVLNPPKRANVGALCGDEGRQSNAAGLSPSDGRVGRSPSSNSGRSDVELAGALCRDGKDIRQVTTGADNVSGPNDPAFHEMIQRATAELTTTAGEVGVFHGSDQDR